MSETVKLTTQDGHELGAYVARPEGIPRGGLVVIQEIFGVNQHIRSVADGYAKDGFLAIAPAIFDRIERDVVLPYGGEGGKRAYEYMGKVEPPKALLDVAAALAWVRAESGSQRAGVLGFCYGGFLSWLSACNLDPQAAVGYYPGGIANVADQTPHCPVMLHFGKLDSHIPLSSAEKVHALHPEVQVFVYDGAGHAFNRDVWPETYDAESAMLARERSLAFLKEHVLLIPS